MITVNIKGGLGNQMFQYACGRALALRNYDRLTLARDERKGDATRPFSLTNFNIKAAMARGHRVFFSKLKERLKQKITKEFNVNFNPKILTLSCRVYLDGYFQSEQYFKDYERDIREDFALKVPLQGTKAVLAEMIKNDQQAVSLHVRRGDYLSHPDFGGVVDKEYYERAAKYILNKIPQAKFYVFSDDIGWCQKELSFLKDATYISNPELKDFEEMFLMSLSKHHIIANSSFSWWGAWLNADPRKIVLVPSRWSNLNEEWYRDIIPSSWIRL